MGRRLTGYLLLAGAVLLALSVVYLNSRRGEVPLVFSPQQILGSVWRQYKKEYLEPTTYRTLDKQRNNITTSEGESYAMLRAVWMSDKDTFDKSWGWTRDNLGHPGDHLFSWLSGMRPDGTFGVLTSQGGATTASDADQDIALALIFAYARWQDPSYLTAARSIITDIWDKEVLIIGGIPYLAANDLEKTSTQTSAIINPSYLSPASYRLFAEVDPTHPWGALVDSSYKLIDKSTSAPLGGSGGALPPDWLRIDKRTGALLVPEMGLGTSTLSTAYGYDALRIPWRLALDWEWNADPRAKATLEKMKILSDSWRNNSSLASVYSHEGAVVTAQESPAMYGGALGYFALADSAAANDLYAKKLQSLFNPDLNAWKQPLAYYDENWAWFGIALYNHLLPNLAASLPPQALRP